MLRGLGRIASLAIVLALATGLVGCSQYGKLQAKRSFKEANVLYAQQEYKRASVLYEEAIKNDPDLSVAYFYLANSYDKLFKPSRKGEKENDATSRRPSSSTRSPPKSSRTRPTRSGRWSTSSPPTRVSSRS